MRLLNSGKPVFSLLVLLCLLAFTCLAQAALVTGQVYLDANGNARLDPGETGLAGVCVTDGDTVVKTDSAGHYALDVAPGYCVLRLTNPPGYWFSGAFWQGVTAKEGQPVQVNFGLKQQAQPLPTRIIVMSDVHICKYGLARFEKGVQHLDALEPKPAFVLVLGDLVMDLLQARSHPQVDSLFAMYKEALSKLDYPVFNLPGNHEHVGYDSDFDRQDEYFGKGAYRLKLGPLYYSFNYGPYHFLMLDTTIPDPAGRGYKNAITPRCMAWLKKDLAEVPAETYLVALMHEPAFSLSNRFALGKLLTTGHKLAYGFSGHTHTLDNYRFFGAQFKGDGAVCGGWWRGDCPDGNPPGYFLVTLAPDGKLTPEYKPNFQ